MVKLPEANKTASSQKVAIYARCSTDEKHQDVDVQLAELRRYCQAYGWHCDEYSEYDSGFKGEQPKLKALLEKIRRKEYSVLLVYSLDRFSRQHPSKVNAWLDQIVYQFGCRFISLQEGLDSKDEMKWHVVRPLFSYFANVFSRNLSEKIKAGIRTKREKGLYKGGRPRKTVDSKRLNALLLAKNGQGWRTIARRYNDGLPDKQKVSATLLRRLRQKHSLDLEREKLAI